MALPTTGYYVEVTIPVAQVNGSTNLTNFPVLLTRDSGSSSGDWDDLFDPSGTPAAANGTDIRCADSTGTQIACEVVSYSQDTTTGGGDGSLELWVKVPTLNATVTPTTIRVYWDGTTSSVETDTGVTAADVWSDRKFQCFPRNTTEAVKNRTGLSPDGTLINPSNFLTTTIFGFDALRRNNSICGVEFPDDPDLDGYGDDITVQILALFGARNGFSVPIMKGTGGVPNSRAYSLQYRRLSSPFNYELFLEVDSTNGQLDRFSDPNPPQIESIEALITVVQDNDNIKFYFNDSLESDKTRWTDLNVPSKNEPLRLFYDGDLDYGTVSLASVSVWDTPRTAEQIYTEYNNLSSPSTFATPGAKTTLGAGGSGTLTAPTATITVTANSSTIVVTPASNLPTQGFYATIEIDRTQVPGTGTRTNFAALFTRDALPDDMFDPSGSPCRTDGGDIRASNSDGSVQFPVDVISCGNDTTTGAADASVEFWVKVDSVNTAALGSNTEIRIYWGDSSYTAQPAATDTYGRNEVWTEYEAVYRFNDNATITDRTGNGRDLTVFGSPTVSTTGQAWGENCIAFAGSGSGDYAISPDTFSTSVAFTVNVVFDNYVPANSGPYSRFIEFGGYATGDGGVGLERPASSTSTTTLSYPHYTAGSAASTSVTVSSVNPNWFNSSAQAVATSNSATLYVNGSFLKTHSSLRADSSSAALVFGGDARETGNNNDYDVTFAYIGKTNFSAEWIATEYNNQSAPGTFVIPGATTTLGGSSGTDYDLAGNKGTVTVSGGAATFDLQVAAVSSELTADKAVLTVSGGSSALEVSYVANANKGALSIVGNDSQFTTNYNLSSEKGTVAVSGSAAVFDTNSQNTLAADKGIVSITGGEASLAASSAGSLAANKGTLAVTGGASNIAVSYVTTTSTTNLTVAGGSAGFNIGERILVDKGVLSLVGGSAGFISDYNLLADTGNIVVLGGDANYSTGTPQDNTLDGDKAVLTVTANSSQLEARFTLFCPPGQARCLVNNTNLIGPPRGGGVGVDDTSHLERLKLQQQRREYLIRKDDEEVAAMIVTHLVA